MQRTVDLGGGYTDRGHAGAYRKGRKARAEGLTLDDCPYRDKRKVDGRVTFSRAFRKAWVYGWDDRDRELARANIPRSP